MLSSCIRSLLISPDQHAPVAAHQEALPGLSVSQGQPAGWLGRERMSEILAADSFVCHKNNDMQCAGHMLINGHDNAFVRLANRLSIPLDLVGREQVFESKEACIEHHSHSSRAAWK